MTLLGSSFTEEQNLRYVVVGSFESGIILGESDDRRNIYNYDHSEFFLAEGTGINSLDNLNNIPLALLTGSSGSYSATGRKDALHLLQVIEIYYTNAPNFAAEQTEPSRSIGGWFSNSLVPNGGEGAVFQAVGLLSLQTKRNTTLCLAVSGEALRLAITATESEVFDFSYAVGSVVKVDKTANKQRRQISQQAVFGRFKFCSTTQI